MLHCRYAATVACVAVLVVELGIAQQRPYIPPAHEAGVFQWCKKAECTNRRMYQHFHKIEEFQTVNSSQAIWEIHVGLWSSSEVFVLLAPRGAGFRRDVDSFYELNIKIWHPRMHNARAQSSIIRYAGHIYVTGASATYVYEQPWLLTWKEFRPFIIKVTHGGPGQNVSLESPEGRVLLRLRAPGALDVRYVSFASIRSSESRIFFDCPNLRHGSVKFLPKAVAPPLGRDAAAAAAPGCPLEPCGHCAVVYLPVCSAAHRTHRNECFLRCVEGPAARALHKGVCYHWLWQM